MSGKQARRTAQVSILKTQFRQAGEFTSDQLLGFFAWITLGNEVNDDTKKGISRIEDYYRMQLAAINDYFHQEVLARPTLMSEKEATMAVWKASIQTSPLKLAMLQVSLQM